MSEQNASTQSAGNPPTGNPLATVTQDVASLPEDKFLEAVELLNAMAEHDPIGSLMTGIRPRLRSLRPSRGLSVKRMLCDPFEDLLAQVDESTRPEGRIPRQSIDPLWRLLLRRNGAHFHALQAELKQISRRDPQRVAELAERIWRTASATLANEADLGKGIPSALPLIRSTLTAAPEIAAFKQEVTANPIPKLDRRVAAAIQKGLKSLVTRGRPVDGFLYVIASRLYSASELLVCLDTVDVAIPTALSDRLKQSSIDDIASDTARFKSAAQSMDPQTLAGEAVRLVQAVMETQRSLGKSSKTLLASKTEGFAETIRDALRSQVIERVPEAVAVAFSPSADTESLIEAENLARAMWSSRHATSLVGLDHDRNQSVATIRENLLTHINRAISVLDQSKDKENPIPVNENELKILYRSIRMIELVEGSEAASKYVEKARSYG